MTGDEADALRASLAGQEYEDYRRKLEAVRVLPVPVTMTGRCFRNPSSICPHTARMAPF